MDKSLVAQLKECIEIILRLKDKEIILFPYGDVGIQADYILKNAYGIRPAYIIDNNLCNFNQIIKPISILKNIDEKKYCLLICSTNEDIYGDLKADVINFCPGISIVELECMKNKKVINEDKHISLEPELITKCGKYSYGPLCNHPLVESIGAFCSVNISVDVVSNKPRDFISLSPFLYADENVTNYSKRYEDYSNEAWFFPGVKPLQGDRKRRRITIGNDVWLGKNVIITNYSNIGNGVIAGAGAVITKDVPDYAIVMGVPARVVRYRFTPSQIEALNRIKWWDWSDEKIRENYADFYLPIGDFIEKHEHDRV